MSSRKIVVEGVPYMRSRDAARVVGLAPDYISSLARESIIDGKRHQGLWFINLVSLKQFMRKQERQKEIWRARMSLMRREEQRLAGHPAAIA